MIALLSSSVFLVVLYLCLARLLFSFWPAIEPLFITSRERMSKHMVASKAVTSPLWAASFGPRDCASDHLAHALMVIYCMIVEFWENQCLGREGRAMPFTHIGLAICTV